MTYMPSSVIDSTLFGGGYSTPEVKALFEDRMILQNWLAIEAALARTQADMGIIPEKAAVEIELKANADNMDVQELADGMATIHHTLVPTLRCLQHLCVDGAGEYIHMGATTQDITDTGYMLSIKKAFDIIYRDVLAAQDALLELVRTYRDTPMAGRSHTQQGAPITFGYKCAVWASEVQRGLERMDDCRKRCFVGELHGAMGNMSGLGPLGMDISSRTIRRLGLSVPDTAWHTSRDRMAEICYALSIVSCTFGTIGHELASMQRTEIAEVAEKFGKGEVYSSTMPHKRNPNGFEAIQCLARLIKAEACAAQESMFCDHERDGAMWKIEWKAVTDCIIMAAACAAKAANILQNLQVYPDKMMENLFVAHGLMMSERVMFALGKKIGKQTAHEVVYRIAMDTFVEKAQFRDKLLADPLVAENLSAKEIDTLMDPSTYTGLSGDICDKVLVSISEARARQEDAINVERPKKKTADVMLEASMNGWQGQ